jgi:hypothetical protein
MIDYCFWRFFLRLLTEERRKKHKQAAETKKGIKLNIIKTRVVYEFQFCFIFFRLLLHIRFHGTCSALRNDLFESAYWSVCWNGMFCCFIFFLSSREITSKLVSRSRSPKREQPRQMKFLRKRRRNLNLNSKRKPKTAATELEFHVKNVHGQPIHASLDGKESSS